MRLWVAIWLGFSAITAAEEVLTERAERHALRDQAVGLMHEDNFKALDELAGKLWSSRARFEDGSWRLAYFYESLDGVTERFNTEAWEQHLAHLRRWCDTRPDSVTARIVLAHALMGYAGSAKGESDGKAKEDVERILEQARPLPALDPAWHHARLDLGIIRRWDSAKFEQAYREAIQFEPGYYPFYVSKASYLRQSRPDAPQTVERFAAQTAEDAKDDALYTRTLMWLLWSERDEFFDKYGVSWERMKRGFEKMQHEYPTSVWIANNFCMFDCMANDRSAAREQFQRIGNDWNPYVWKDEGRFQQWRGWTQSDGRRPPKTEPPESLSRPYTGGPLGDREILMQQVADLLLAEKYDELEEMGQKFRAGKQRLPDGLWKLHFYYAGLSKPAEKTSGGEEWTFWLESLEKWKKARPDSVAARIALAGAYDEYAWAGRSRGYASKVTAQGWQMFHDRTATARRLLEESEARCSADPQWHWLMMRLSRAQSSSATDRQALFERAIQREPTYHPFYFERAQQLLPRWFGQPGDVEQLAAQYGDREALYARIAWAVQPTKPDKSYFEVYKFSWPRMRESFRQIPQVPLNLNRFCWFACMAGDKATARELFERLGKDWTPECWKSEARWRQWRQWASDAGSPPQ